MFPVDIAKFLRTLFLYNISGGCFWQSYHGTVKSSGSLFFDFTALRAFNFDQKLSRNTAQIVLCYHVTKQFLSCLNWLVTCFQFQNIFWKNINCFWFWLKNIQKVLQKQLCNITCQKTFFPCTLQLIRCFQVQGMIWRMEECHENI